MNVRKRFFVQLQKLTLIYLLNEYSYYDQWCADKDDVLTSLIHLGYLSHDRDSRTCRIPNREVATEFKNANVYNSSLTCRHQLR